MLFGGAGVLAYLAFGPEIQTVVITNLDSESKFVQAVSYITQFQAFAFISPHIVGTILVLIGHPPFSPVATLPCSSYYGERDLLTKW